MKRTIYIILSIYIGFMAYSCDEWLYLEPEDGIIREDFWKSEEDVHAAVMGCYASLLGNTSGTSGYSIPELLFLWGEIRADMVLMYRLRTDFFYIMNGDILQDNGVCRWNQFYRTINFCNTILEFAESVRAIDPSFTAESLKQYESEVLALRALMYFYLTRTFDEVPVILSASTSDNQKFIVPKSPRGAVLNQIKSDLRLAEESAPVTYGDINSDKGRITKYTINAIQADVYLWCNQYDSCIIACDKVINSGRFGLVQSGAFWFSTLYGTGNSSEGIFELQFSQSKLNPYYYMFKTNKYLMASPETLEEFFPFDENILPDSADIRGDGASYKSSDNYTIWKYIGKDKNYIRSQNESYAHFIVYRYAEILLFKAEALIQQGNAEDALSLIHMIRKRANASSNTDIEGGTTDIRSLTDFLLAERTREFAYEGKRWFDVLRIAKRNHYERKDIMINMVIRSAPIEKQITIINKYQDTLSHYLPIFYTELDANPELVQNPFYAEE
jgi:hypothetical protein